MPFFNLIGLLKWYYWWNRILQRNGKAFQGQVEVFLIDVHPIWHTTQEMMNWSRISSRKLSRRNFLVHVITAIDKVHFTFFTAFLGMRMSICQTLGPVLGPKIIYMHRYSIQYRVRYWGRSKNRLFASFNIEVFDFDNMNEAISKKNLQYTGTRFIVEAFVHSILMRHRSLFDIGYYIALHYRDIRISKAKTLMSYLISVQGRDIRISKFFLRYQRFYHYRVRYAVSGAAGRTSHVPAPPTGTASWSSTRLDGLYTRVTVLTLFHAGVQLPSVHVAAVART